MNVKNEQSGQINVLLIPFILTIVLLVAALGFGGWAFTERTKYKTQVDPLISSAVKIAVERAKTEKDNEFVQKEKEPYRVYNGPESFGSFNLSYPKTWSVYEDNSGSASTVKFQPAVVSSGVDVSLATVVEVTNIQYDTEVKKYESQVKAGEMKATPYSLPKVPSVKGLRFEGQIPGGKKSGVVVVLPLRDKTIKISSQSTDYFGDYNNAVLATFTFIP
ncbi:hypothetical protein A3F37_03095 [Candidatus Saccharibacteria bacterium RIFCSPHIGHO2_12_FULL_41_12]|nr:MAG: hypothetical protein A3F37_03095 [Candidatus Saccharibacteria bacterium RIFCSPHIGHO2_12_FULL_41_12]